MRKVHCPYNPTKKTYSSAHSLRYHVEWNHPVNGENMVKAIVNKVVDIPDGLHMGTIRNTKLRKTDDYGDYLDFDIEVSDVKDGKINFSMPLNISIKSDLGKLLMTLGYPVAKHVDESIETDDIVLGRKITFLVNNVSVKDDDGKVKGVFPRVLKETIKSSEKEKI